MNLHKIKKEVDEKRDKFLELMLDQYSENFFGFPPSPNEQGILIGGQPPRIDRLEKLLFSLGR